MNKITLKPKTDRFYTDSFVPVTDSNKDIGSSYSRVRDIYLSGGLSDGNNANYKLTIPDTTSWTANKEIATTDQAFNVINASDIGNTWTNDQITLLTNGKPTIIKGTYSNLDSPILTCPRLYGGVYYGLVLGGRTFNDYNVLIAYSLNNGSFSKTLSKGIVFSGTETLSLLGVDTFNNKDLNYYLNNVYHYAINSTTTLQYETINNISISANTTFTLATAPSNTYPEYKANITNSGASDITITLTGVSKVKTNDSNITIVEGTNSTFTIPANASVELNIQNGKAIVFNWDA